MMLFNVYKFGVGIVEVSDCRFIRIRISSITCICIKNRQTYVSKDFLEGKYKLKHVF